MSDDSDIEVLNAYQKLVNESIGKTSKKSVKDMDSSDLRKYGLELKEENKRLKELIKLYRKETKNITFKCVDMRDREKTSIMQTLELFKLNKYLIENIPNSKQLLDKYMNRNERNGTKSSVQKSSDYNNVEEEIDEEVDEVFVNHNDSDYVENNEENNDKNQSNSESESEKSEKSNSTPVLRRSSRKRTESSANSGRYTRRSRKLIENNNDSNAISDDDSNDDTYNSRRKKDSILSSYGRGKRLNHSSVEQKRRQTNETDVESIETLSPLKSDVNSRVSRSATKSVKVNNRTRSSSSSTVREEEQKKKPKKRVKRPRVEPEIGRFPCTFDKNQCQAVLQTKELFKFHMSGHLEAKFVCPFCAYTGPTIQVIKRHIMQERETEPKFGDDSDDEDKTRMHQKKKIYKCNACLVCHKIHERDEKRCNHMSEDRKNWCKFSHDIDHEFKEHLRQHMGNTFANYLKDKEKRRKKIREIVDKFVDNKYFENNARKRFMLQKYTNNNSSHSEDSD